MVHAVPLPQMAQFAFGGLPIVLLLLSKGIEHQPHVLQFVCGFKNSIGLGDRLKVVSHLSPLSSPGRQIQPVLHEGRPGSTGQSHVAWKEGVDRFSLEMKVPTIGDLVRTR